MRTPPPPAAPAPSGSGTPPTAPDRDGLEVLDRAECLRLLGTATIGRVGVTVGALPVVLPVRFQLQGDAIVFVAAVGTTLEGASRNAVVAFEADDVDPESCAGWSVTGTGLARDASVADLVGLADSALPRWAALTDQRLVVLTTELLSGHRAGPRLGPATSGPAPRRPVGQAGRAVT
jgi:hypothetical protein